MVPHDVNVSGIRDDNLRIRLERALSWDGIGKIT